MLRASAFRTHLWQAVAFTPDGGPSVARTAAELLPQWVARFDGSPIVLPQVDMLPPDVPRVQLTSADGAWRFDAGPNRIALVKTAVRGEPDASETGDFFDEAVERFETYRTAFSVRLGRLAAIVTRAVEQDEPGIALARHFTAERWHTAPLNRPEGFELHAHKRYTPTDLPEVNSWVRIKTGNVRRDDGPRRAIVVEQDVNTLAEAAGQANFDDTGIRVFYRAVANELDQILGLYFPEQVPS